MSCLKNYVMREPLVDTVDKRQICSEHYPLKVQNFLRFVSLNRKSFLDVRFENDDDQRHWNRFEFSTSSSS